MILGINHFTVIAEDPQATMGLSKTTSKSQHKKRATPMDGSICVKFRTLPSIRFISLRYTRVFSTLLYPVLNELVSGREGG